jgi:AAHS family benzoate transporter-like MFS transporter
VAAYLLLAGQGWRVVMGLGALPVLLSPLIAWLLPESRAYLAARGRAADAMKLADRYGLVAPPAETPFDDAGKQRPASPLTLLAKGSRRATIGFWLATFAGMILVYGLNTWLPQIMRAAGYDLGPSILFLGVFATASAFGGVALGRIADIAGRRRTIAGAFLLGATAILLLSWRAALPVTYALVALAGVGSTAAAVIVTSYLSSYFPAPARATAVGSAVSFSRAGAVSGPLLGGFIATHRLGVQWNFYAFALVALLAALSIQLVPDRKIASAGGDA